MTAPVLAFAGPDTRNRLTPHERRARSAACASCAYCGDAMQTTRRHARYCSGKCRAAASDKRRARVCDGCKRHELCCECINA